MADFVVDASALVATLNKERDALDFETALQATDWAIGLPTLFEAKIWLLRKRPAMAPAFLEYLALASPVFVEFSQQVEPLAVDAFARFGKGRHPARLNFGDCMAYAVAKHLDLPLLFKGGDFGKTDITIHPASVIIE